MADIDLKIRCQRCGTQMELRDPAPGSRWTPDQFWVCARCGRHFWSTYPDPSKPKEAPAAAQQPAAKPASQRPPAGSGGAPPTPPAPAV